MQWPQNLAQYWCENGLAQIFVVLSNKQSTPGLSWQMTEREGYNIV